MASFSVFGVFFFVVVFLLALPCRARSESESVHNGGRGRRLGRGRGRAAQSSAAECSRTTTTSVDVVIVGGGMAGLKAAETIERYGRDGDDGGVSYVLLEGQDRVGGRMRKREGFGGRGGFTIEDGANWIEGGSGNPIFELARKYGLDLYRQRFTDWVTYEYDGTPVDGEYVLGRLDDYLDAFECLNDEADEAWEDFCRRRRRRTRELSDPGAREALERCGWTPANGVDDTIDWQFIDFEFAMVPSRVSLYSFPEQTFDDFDERRFLVTDQRGFEHIARRFARDELRQDPVTGTEVVSVEWNNGGRDDAPARVRAVRRSNGSCHVYNAEKVISTVSVGVLENRRDLFDPPLDMRDNVYEMATYQKVFFSFTEKFWSDDHDFINVAMPRDRRGECAYWQSLDKGVYLDKKVLEAPRKADVKRKGIMFDIVAEKDLTVTALDITALPRGKNRIFVYTRDGSFRGNEDRPGRWTRVFAGSVTCRGRSSFTRLPEGGFKAVRVGRGETRSFYVFFRKKAKFLGCAKGVQQADGDGDGEDDDGGLVVAGNDDLWIGRGVGLTSAWNKRGGQLRAAEFSGAVVYHETAAAEDARRVSAARNVFGGKKGGWEGISTEIMPGSRILFCTITTDAIDKLGGTITAEIAETFLEPLRAIFGDDYREHDQIYIPEWTNDEWTYGSYANWVKGKSPEQFYSFYDPREDDRGRPVVYLGGSASCERYWEFVHGAYYSGEQTAFMVLRDLGIKDKEVLDRWDHICSQ